MSNAPPLATVPDISKLNGSFSTQQWAALIVLGLALLALLYVFRPRKLPGGGREGGLLVGTDSRISTSKTIALLWTIVVGYCLLALVLVATGSVSAAAHVPTGHIPPGFVQAALKPLAPDYLVMLGGPFAAAIIAKTIVSQRVQDGTLQKTVADKAAVRDLVSDDAGGLDLVDLQYTLFNFIAAVYVITQFVPHPARGMPDIPSAFAALTGASALLYTGNKGLMTNPLALTGVLPDSVRPEAKVLLAGRNLVIGDSATGADAVQAFLMPTAASSGIPGTKLDFVRPTAGGLEYAVPRGTPPGTWDLHVATDAGATGVLPGALTVLEGSGSLRPAATSYSGDQRASFAPTGGGVDLED